jgi:hypothetical protein
VDGGEPRQHRVTGYTGGDHRSGGRPITRIGAVAGGAAVLVGVGLGTAMLIGRPAPVPTTGPTAQHITVTAAPTIPLSALQLADLIRQRPDYGALTDPQRRASCLSGLGYPASVQVLGAQPVEIGDQPAVVLVLAGDGPTDLVALAVHANCNAADTGLIADTRISRP